MDKKILDNLLEKRKLVQSQQAQSTDSPEMDIAGMDGAQVAGLDLSKLTPAGAAIGAVKDTVGGINDSGKFTEQTQYEMPVFPNGAPKMEPGRIKLTGKEAEQAADEAAKKTQAILSPAYKSAARDARDTGETFDEQMFREKQILQDTERLMGAAEKQLEKYATSVRVNPSQFMDDLGEKGRTMATIALALGGFSAGLTGQPNPALQILNKRIEENIKAQERNITLEMEKFQGLKDIAGQRVDFAKSALGARQMAQIIELTKIKSGVEYAEKYATSETQKEQAAMLKFKIEQQLQNGLMAFDELVKGKLGSGQGAETKALLEAGMRALNLNKTTVGTEAQTQKYGIKPKNKEQPKQEVKPETEVKQNKPKQTESFLEGFGRAFQRKLAGSKE